MSDTESISHAVVACHSASLNPSNSPQHDPRVPNDNVNTDSIKRAKQPSKLSLKYSKRLKKSRKDSIPSSIDSESNTNAKHNFSKQHNSEQHDPSKEDPCESNANAMIETFEQLASIDTNENKTVSISTELLRQFQLHPTKTSSILSPDSKNPLHDISNTFIRPTRQGKLTEITQDSPSVRSNVLDKEPVYNPSMIPNASINTEHDPVYNCTASVSVDPYSEEISKTNFLSSPPFPGKTACEYTGNTEGKKKCLIANLNMYAIALQYSKLNRYTHSPIEERLKIPKMLVTFSNGTKALLYEPIVHSLFEPTGQPRWASEIFLHDTDDVENLNSILEKYGLVPAPLCGDLGDGLDTLRIFFLELATFQCEEDTTTRLIQKQVILHSSRLVKGAHGKVGFANIEHSGSMLHSKFLTFLDKDMNTASSTSFKNNPAVQEALKNIKQAVKKERQSYEFVLRNVICRGLYKTKQKYPNLFKLPGSNFKSLQTSRIGIETSYLLNCLHGELEPEKDDNEFWKEQSNDWNTSCLDSKCDFLKTPHICAISLSGNAVSQETHEAHEKEIHRKVHFMSKVLDKNYSEENVNLQLYCREEGQAMSNMSQIKACKGLIPKPYHEVKNISNLRMLKSTKDNAIDRGETVESGRIHSKEMIERRLESTKDNAVDRGETVESGRIHSKEMIERRLESTKDNAVDRGETVEPGRIHSKEMNERMLKSTKDNAVKRGETVAPGRIQSKEKIERRLKKQRDNAVDRGETVLPGKFNSKEARLEQSSKKSKEGYNVFECKDRKIKFVCRLQGPLALFLSDFATTNLTNCILSTIDNDWSRKRTSIDFSGSNFKKKTLKNCFRGAQTRPSGSALIHVHSIATGRQYCIERYKRLESENWEKPEMSDQTYDKDGTITPLAPVSKERLRNYAKADEKEKATTVSKKKTKKRRSPSKNILSQPEKKQKKRDVREVITLEDSDDEEVTYVRKGNLKNDRDYE